jgi:hypothetical protein
MVLRISIALIICGKRCKGMKLIGEKEVAHCYLLMLKGVSIYAWLF